VAGLIYWDSVEPDRERQLAQQVAELKAIGVAVTTIAAQLGISKDQVSRLLAIAESLADAK
jgi:DNA invertase Pin-like site-specific DNA recombinase